MKLIIGVADMKVSNNPQARLITYSLGSCLAVCIYDPVVRVGGLLHLMLPDSKIDPDKAQKNPFMFADTGIPLLFKEAYRMGAVKNRLEVRLTGASQILDDSGVFNIGKRNHLAARKILWKNNVMVKAEDIGGTEHRTVRMDLSNGAITLNVPGRRERSL